MCSEVEQRRPAYKVHWLCNGGTRKNVPNQHRQWTYSDLPLRKPHWEDIHRFLHLAWALVVESCFVLLAFREKLCSTYSATRLLFCGENHFADILSGNDTFEGPSVFSGIALCLLEPLQVAVVTAEAAFPFF